MINFIPSSVEDIPQIHAWVSADPEHNQGEIFPTWWLTGGNCFMAFRIDDSQGPTMYVRFEKEDPYVRMYVQFAPSEECSKLRTARVIKEAIPALIAVAEQEGARGFVYESRSQSLISFMERLFGFKPRDGSENVDDHILIFEEVAQ